MCIDLIIGSFLASWVVYVSRGILPTSKPESKWTYHQVASQYLPSLTLTSFRSSFSITQLNMTLIHYIIDIILSKYDITQIHLYLNFLDPTSLWLASRASVCLETPSAGSSGSTSVLFAHTAFNRAFWHFKLAQWVSASQSHKYKLQPKLLQ